jgi:magnesium-transporting ATPase (P-type)
VSATVAPVRDIDPTRLEIADLAAHLRTDLDRGLTSSDAEQRLAENGANELRAAPAIPQWRKLVRQFKDPLIYLLLGAVLVSTAVWLVEGREGLPIDALVIATVVVMNAILGYLQEARAERAVAALQKMTAVSAGVIRDGLPIRVPSAHLVRGDVLTLAEGDAVGADARLIASAALHIQEASLTGESEAVLKEVGTLMGPAALGDQHGMVFKGTAVAQGTGRAVVTATGMDTEMGAIAEMLEATHEDPTPLQREIARIGRMLGIAVVIIAVVVVGTVFLISDIRTPGDAVTVLLLGVSLAVAAVPEGLPAILSVVLALGVQRMAKHRAVVKRLSSVETLGSASVIASDKTGTLTKSEMTVQRILSASGSTDVTGVGYAPVGTVEHQGRPLDEGALLTEDITVLSGGSLANNASLHEGETSWDIQGDATEAAFLVAEQKLGVAERRLRRFTRVGEVPFTSDRKLMSTVEIDHEHADERILVTKGAPDLLLELCGQVRIGADVVPLTPVLRQQLVAGIDGLADEALRALSVAYRPLAPTETDISAELERDLIFVGTVGMIDPPRPEAAVAIAVARRAGIRVLMITGDHPRTAVRIAADLGIVEPGAPALTGLELDELEPDAFADAVRETSVYARVSPKHKLRIVDALQADGNVVAMTGDGVNDAPALKSADIGIAMGLTGTEVTKEAAKMILADDNFATIVEAVREGRGIFDNIQKFLRYLLSSNMGEVLTVFFGVVLAGVIGLTGNGEAVVLPLLATQILWINLITDTAPALAMGIDPETDDVMSRPPRTMTERVIDRQMWTGVLLTGAVMAVVTLATIDLYLPQGLFAGTDDLATARTAGFTVLVLAQLINCFNCRSETVSAFSHVFVNPWLWAAIGLSLLLQVAVVNLGFLNTAFGTAPLSWTQWLICLAMASAVLWFAELRKLVLRARRQR